MPDSTEGQGRNSLRRVPKQERSRDRIDEILKVSMDLIGRKGIDAVTMKEIAALSGGPIASVYQYFPNKSAIIGMLYERYVDEVRSFVFDHIKGIRTSEEALEAAIALFDFYYHQMRERPSTQDLLNAIQADKRLADLDITETRIQADMFYEATLQFVIEARRKDYRDTLLVIFHMAGSTLRLALMVPQDEAGQLVKQFKSIIHAQANFYLKGSFPATL
jgi:AcrR family transcriptional regulator